MGFNLIPTDWFKKEVKRLNKKYPSLKNDLAELANRLSHNPTSGIPLGNDVFKIRLSITSKGKGKSAGARIIYYLISQEKEIYLLTIYDKSEYDSIDDRLLKKLVADILRDNNSWA